MGTAIDELLVEDVGLPQQLLVALVPEDLERVEKLDIGVGAKREPQTPIERLLGKDRGHARPHRGQDVDGFVVPAFLEHSHADDDPVRASGLLELVESGERIIRSVGVDGQGPAGVAPTKERFAIERRHDLLGLGDALRDHEHERVDRGLRSESVL